MTPFQLVNPSAAVGPGITSCAPLQSWRFEISGDFEAYFTNAGLPRAGVPFTFAPEFTEGVGMINGERFYRERSARELCERLKQQLHLFRSNLHPSRFFTRTAADTPGQPIAEVEGTDFDSREPQRLLGLIENIRREFPDIFDEYSSVLRRVEVAWRNMSPQPE